MSIFTVITTYGNGLFGSYSSPMRARIALEHFLKEASNVIYIYDIGNYSYKFITDDGEIFYASIVTDTLDWEYQTGQI